MSTPEDLPAPALPDAPIDHPEVDEVLADVPSREEVLQDVPSVEEVLGSPAGEPPAEG